MGKKLSEEERAMEEGYLELLKIYVAEQEKQIEMLSSPEYDPLANDDEDHRELDIEGCEEELRDLWKEIRKVERKLGIRKEER